MRLELRRAAVAVLMTIGFAATQTATGQDATVSVSADQRLAFGEETVVASGALLPLGLALLMAAGAPAMAAPCPGNADALEHPQGFLEVFNGRGNYSVERLLAILHEHHAVAGSLQDAPIPDHDWPAALEDIRMGQCLQHDFGTDPGRIAHGDGNRRQFAFGRHAGHVRPFPLATSVA